MRGLIVLAAGVLLAACKSGSGSGETDPKASTLSHDEAWCPEGFETGPSDTCFALPPHPAKDTAVLVFVHGVYEGHGVPAEWTAIHGAIDRGFAVVVPRGKRRLCALRAELKDRYCWPEDPEDTGAMKSIVAEWEKSLWQVDALLEGGAHKRYVIGAGSGATFLTFLATHGLFASQAYALLDAEPLGALGKVKPAPIDLVATDSAVKAKDLHDALAKATIPHAWCPRPGPPTLTPDDVDAALRFFKHETDGTLKPQPGGLYPCDPPTKK